MAEVDYAPLSAACYRALVNKINDKRKSASVEIEKMVRDLRATGNTAQIQKLIKFLGKDLALSHNVNSRKGGLLGLAAVANALGRDANEYVEELVRPMLASFVDQDSRVRYYACEALYNVVKVCQGDVLILFNEIFDALSKLAADVDQSVKVGSEMLDKAMKDIVTTSPAFNLVAFIPLLRERILTKNPFTRQFVVSWVSVLYNVPDIDMVLFLPQILDGLLKILSDPTPEVRKMCETVLNDFLEEIIRKPSKVDFAAMVNTLIARSQASEEIVQFTALLWLKEFISLAGSSSILPFTAGMLTAILPRLSYERRFMHEEAIISDNCKSNSFASHRNMKISIMETAHVINLNLMQLVTIEDHKEDTLSSKENSTAVKTVSENVALKPTSLLNLATLVEVLSRELLSESSPMPSKSAVLRWISHLHSKLPHRINAFLEQDILPALIKALSDDSEDVVLLDLEVLAQIFSASVCRNDTSFVRHNQVSASNSLPATHFRKFLVTLLEQFNTPSTVHQLENRGSFIIKQLCLLMNAEDIYRSLSEILLDYEDLAFAYTMVKTLNNILLTSCELSELRSQLRDLKTDESCSLFCCLYKSWCHSPVSTVALCLLTKNYKHACDLLMLFGDRDVTLEFLTEIDQLVQLIESPIFAYLRLELLDVEHNGSLVKSLYGLLMLLPQGEAFHTLRKRLQCIPTYKSSITDRGDRTSHTSPTQPKMDFSELLRRFQAVQEKHKEWRRLQQRRKVTATLKSYGEGGRGK